MEGSIPSNENLSYQGHQSEGIVVPQGRLLLAEPPICGMPLPHSGVAGDRIVSASKPPLSAKLGQGAGKGGASWREKESIFVLGGAVDSWIKWIT